MNLRNLVLTLILGVGFLLALMWAIAPESATPAQAMSLPQSAGVRRYVSSVSGEDGSNDCAAPTHPCRTIQHAVDQAAEGDELWIAAYDVSGTVFPPNLITATARYTGTDENVISVTKSLTLKGGYIYYHPTGVTQWLEGAEPSEVNGEDARRPLYVSGEITVTLEMLAFVHGHAPLGGNVYVEQANVLFRATPIQYGSAYIQSRYDEGKGGGLYVREAHVSFDPGNLDWGGLLGQTDLLPIRYNQAEQFGGGIYVEGGEPLLAGLAVLSNTAPMGGGIYLSRGTPYVLGGIVMGNHAAYDGGGLYAYYSAARIAGMAIYSNTAARNGGGAFIYGPVRFNEEEIPMLANSYLRYNHAASGGGLYLKRVVIGMANNVLAENEAGSLGGGMVVWSSYPQVFHSTIVSNTGESGIYVTNQPGRWWPPTPPFPSRAYFTNTIVASHTVGIHVSNAGYPYPFQNRVQMDGTLWWGNGTDAVADGDGRVLTTTDIFGDPRFTCTGDPPGCLNPYHILTDSIAVDHGVTVTYTLPGTDLFVDIDGDLRPSGEGYDIGADEVVTEGYSIWLLPPLSTLPAAPGQIVTHTHWLVNSGGETDTLTLTLSSSEGWATLVSSPVITLSPQTTATVQVEVIVPADATDGEEERSTVTALSRAHGGLPQAGAVDVTRVLTGVADVAVGKWPDAEGVLQGDTFHFTVVITNYGPLSNTLAVTLTDEMVPSEAIAALDLPPGCSGSAGAPITCTVTLPAGEPPITHQLRFTITTAEAYTGLLNNRVTVQSDVWDVEPDNNRDEAAVAVLPPQQTADVAVGKWADADWVLQGDAVRFTVVITNNGPMSDTLAVTLTDVLSPSEAVAGVELPPGCVNDGGAHLTCTVTLPPGTPPITRALYFTVATSAHYTGSLSNRAEVSSALLDRVAANDAAQASVDIRRRYRLYLPLVLKGTP